MSGLLIKTARAILKTVAPPLYEHIHYKRNEGRYKEIVKQIAEQTGSVVAAGPFKGMHYVEWAVGSAVSPKLIGSYEEELAASIEDAIKQGYERIIDIGCAEGYYAVGMAVRKPQTKVIAFDIDPEARRLCQEMAKLNNASERITIKEGADPGSLEENINGRCLIICDCEGYEAELIDPEKVPSVKSCDLIVELHEHIVEDIKGQIAERFESTHDISIIKAVERDSARYPILNSFSSARDKEMALNEFRPANMCWAIMKRKTA